MQATTNTDHRVMITTVSHHRFFLRYCVPVILFLFLQSAATAQAERPFHIKGRFGKYDQPAIVYLVYGVNSIKHIDSARLTNGNFEFTGEVTFPTHASLLLSRNGKRFTWPYDERMFFIDTTVVRFTSQDSAVSAVVTGTSINSDYTAFLRDLDKMIAQAPVHTTPVDDSISRLQSPYWMAITHFVEQHPDSWISQRELSTLAYSVELTEEIGRAEALYQKLSKRLQQDEKGQKLEATLQQKRRLLPGMPAPGFSQPDSSGRLVSLSAYRGKIVLLHFWASWCKPCRAENPALRQIYAAYREKGFEVVSVSTDQDRGRWTRAIRDDRLEWPELSDLQTRNAAVELYRVQSFPSSFLLDTEGRILARDLKQEELKTMLAKLLGP